MKLQATETLVLPLSGIIYLRVMYIVANAPHKDSYPIHGTLYWYFIFKSENTFIKIDKID